jgi:hypothetical protein
LRPAVDRSGISTGADLPLVLRSPRRLSGRKFDCRCKWRSLESAEYPGWARSGRRQRAESGWAAIERYCAKADIQLAGIRALLRDFRLETARGFDCPFCGGPSTLRIGYRTWLRQPFQPKPKLQANRSAENCWQPKEPPMDHRSVPFHRVRVEQVYAPPRTTSPPASFRDVTLPETAFRNPFYRQCR